MTEARSGFDGYIADLRIPLDLLQDAAGFGGLADGDCLHGDLRVHDGRVEQLLPPGQAPQHEVLFDADGRIAISGLIEVHAHLDKCHTIDRLHGIGGDLERAIAAQGPDKQAWTVDDIHRRASRGLDEFVAAGCRVVRSHVDWGNTADAPLAWEVLNQIRVARADQIELQLSALIDLDMFHDGSIVEAMLSRISTDAGIAGIFLLGHAQPEPALRTAFSLADRFGLDLDFHVDESLAPGLNGVEQIADQALASGYRGRILCGHACSLVNRGEDDLARISDKLARLDISICALPSTNLYLQGRGPGTPDRRGLTRLRELAAAGVNIAVGSDNVADAFCPLGRHDPMHSLATAVLGAHLDPPFGRWLKSITVDAARALGTRECWIDGSQLSDLWLSDARHTAELISLGLSSPQTLQDLCKPVVGEARLA